MRVKRLYITKPTDQKYFPQFSPSSLSNINSYFLCLLFCGLILRCSSTPLKPLLPGCVPTTCLPHQLLGPLKRKETQVCPALRGWEMYFFFKKYPKLNVCLKSEKQTRTITQLRIQGPADFFRRA